MGQAENPSKPRGTFFQSMQGTYCICVRRLPASFILEPFNFFSFLAKLFGLRECTESNVRAIRLRAGRKISELNENPEFSATFVRLKKMVASVKIVQRQSTA